MPSTRGDEGQAERWLPLVAGAALVVGFMLLLDLFGDGGGDPTALPSGTATSSLPAVTTDATNTAPALATTTTTDAPRARSTILGTLLDGTQYTVHLERPAFIEPQGIQGVVMLDRADGPSVAVGILDVQRGRIDEPSVGAAAVALPAGDWTVTLRIYDALQAEVASAFPDTIEAAFDETPSPGRLPAFELARPLRWATDGETPIIMEVDYGWFSVRRGCPDEALRCSSRRTVALMAGIGDGDGPDLDGVVIESPAPRPVSNALYLDPGPPASRGGADVIWTGAESSTGTLPSASGASESISVAVPPAVASGDSLSWIRRSVAL